MARQAAAVEGSRFSLRGGRDSGECHRSASSRSPVMAVWGGPTGETLALAQTISAGSANFFIDGDVIFGYGFVNLSDRALKENVRAIPEEELQQTFDAVEPQIYDRIDGGKGQIGFVAQDVQASGKLGATMCKTKNLDGRELMALDYQKLSVVLWGVVKKLQKRVEKLEKKKGRKGDSD